MEEKKLKVSRRINWSKWEQYSRESLRMDTALECCNCIKRGQYDCDCEAQDRQAWLNDVTYIRKFEPPPVRPVNKNGAMVIDKYGLIRGPYLYEQWRHYSYFLLDYFHDIVEGKDIPQWHRLFFRHENDFYSGVYSHFYEIHVLLSRQLYGTVTRHNALNDVHRGVDMYENLFPAGILKPSNFRGKGQMLTLHVPHYENCKEIWQENPKFLNFEKIQNKWIKRSVRLKKRVNKMKKFNKKFKFRTMYYLPNKFQNFKRWYPKTKQVPLFYNYKSKNVEWPVFKTDKDLEELHQDYIKDTIEKWLITKAIYICRPTDQIDLVTPLVMANLPTVNGPPTDPDKKPRMCHDGGYEKEIEGYPIPCKMEDLKTVLPNIKKDDYLTKLDDKRGFHLLKMNKESRGLTVFQYKGRNLTYRAVPFGCPKSPAAFQRANAMAMAYGRAFGVRSNLYMDDRLCCDSSNTMINQVPQNCFLTSMLCIASGGFISLTKSDFEPKKVQEFLGLQLDTNICQISVPLDKWKKFVKIIKQALANAFITFEELEMIRGKAVSFILCNPMTKLFIRQMNQTIADALKDPNWKNNMKIKLRPKLKNELHEWIKLDFLEMRHQWCPIYNNDNQPYKVSFTDASLFAIGIKIQYKNNIYSYTEYFSEADQAKPICQKEAIAILKMLQKCKNVLANTTLVHFCDNTNVCFAYKGLGTKNRPLNDIIIDIYRQLHNMNSSLKMYWCSTKLQLADLPSRTVNWNEEFIPWQRFFQICEKFNYFPDIDMMATAQNTKAKQYIMWGKPYQKQSGLTECIGTDFFAMDPKQFKNYKLYIFPPKPMTSKVAIHLAKFYENHQYMMIFHAFQNIPLGLENIINQGARMIQCVETELSIIPCENQLEFHGEKYAGKWNNRSKTTFILFSKSCKICWPTN